MINKYNLFRYKHFSRTKDGVSEQIRYASMDERKMILEQKNKLHWTKSYPYTWKELQSSDLNIVLKLKYIITTKMRTIIISAIITAPAVIIVVKFMTIVEKIIDIIECILSWF
ncbi:MAG: hypothetical protein KAT68_17840 [Bacteroidales bacterium]|nr:hypothetical protein [Bacteroidales bacterium]